MKKMYTNSYPCPSVFIRGPLILYLTGQFLGKHRGAGGVGGVPVGADLLGKVFGDGRRPR
jgi:hypothetical protein